MGNDKNYVPVWFWVVAVLLMAIPGVNLLVAFVGAFLGDNDSRKNFFRAQLLLILLAVILVVIGMAAGFAPAIIRAVNAWFQRTFPGLSEG